MTRRNRGTTRRTDWLWYDLCDRCNANPGEHCLDQRNRLTATIHGQSYLHRPHAERKKLQERLVPFLSPEARASCKEIAARFQVEAARIRDPGDSIAGIYNRERVNQWEFGAHQLKLLADEVPTTRAEPWWSA